jgi:hypothetical protein
LSADPSYAGDELLSVARGVHRGRAYTPVGYEPQPAKLVADARLRQRFEQAASPPVRLCRTIGLPRLW